MTTLQQHDARAVANLILDRGDQLGVAITNMALNKIVYFAHAWSLVMRGQPLVAQRFEAWQHGPLVQDIYHAFKKFGDKPIASRATRLDRTTAQHIVCESIFTASELALLRPVMDYYVPIPASRLRGMTHVSGGPWDHVWNHESASNPGMIIPDEAIMNFYGNRLPMLGVVNAHSKGP